MNIRFTEEQEAAIQYRGGNLLIVACAGSGKTETMAARIVSHVKEGVSRDSIIAFTFTEHAATELKSRIRRRLEMELPQEPSIGDMYVGTIHAFCLRMLKELDHSYRRYEVMDEVRQAALISANFVRFDASERGIGLEALRVQTRTRTYWETVRRFVTTLNIIHQKKLDASTLRDSQLRAAVENYRHIAYGHPNYFLDFDEVIERLIAYLNEDAEALTRLRERFQLLVIDEYQDVDDRQEELIRLLSGEGRSVPVTAVGDDDQALYGFRGATVKNILTFESRYPSVKVITMTSNFRSTHAIVEVASHAIRKVSSRRSKEMVAKHRDTSGNLQEHMADRGDIKLIGDFSEAEQEAQWVAQRIAELRGVVFTQKDGTNRALDYGDMAILLRSVRGAGREFAQVLRDNQIPVVVKGTRGLFDNDEVQLVQAAFCLLGRSDFGLRNNDGDFQLLDTAQTRDHVRELGGRLSMGPMHGLNVERFLGWISRKGEDLEQRRWNRGQDKPKRMRIYPQRIFHEMLFELGATRHEWSPDVMYNLGVFSNLVTQYEAVHQWITASRLKGLCLFLGNWATDNVDEGGLGEYSQPNSVQIMTVHAAKGLEWPVVFVPRVSSYTFPSSRRRQGPETFLRPSEFDPREYASGDDGERRLWYVALTRCAKFLNITSLNRTRKRPTEYFKEIRHEYASRDRLDLVERDRAEPEPPADASLLPTTFSDLTYYWRCPFEYQLRSLMGFSPGVGEQYGYGKQLHNILAELHTAGRDGVPATAQLVEDLVFERFHLRYTRKKPFELLREAALDALQRYVKRNSDNLGNTVAVEKPFEFLELESGALISGVVDLLERVPEPEEAGQRELIGLVDFKAHKWKSAEAFNLLRTNVERQLRLYASAVRYSMPYEPVAATAQIITPSDVPEALAREGVSEQVSVDIAPSKCEKALDDVRTAIRGIKSSLTTGDFPMRGPTCGACAKCDFRAFCAGYEQWRKLDKNTPSLRSVEMQEERDMQELERDLDAGQ